MEILALNAGSSSIKLGLFEARGGRAVRRAKAVLDLKGRPPALKLEAEAVSDTIEIGVAGADDLQAVLGGCLSVLDDRLGLGGLVLAGHRVVHGGEAFTGPVRITEAVFGQLQALVPLAPLHQPPALRLIQAMGALRPGIVCVSLCAYGHEGPWSSRRGFDSIVQNVTGLAATQGSLDKPRNLPVQALDYIAGYLAALGAMVGLARRAEQGGSWLVRVSLVQVAHWLAGLGTVAPEQGVAELPEAELARWLMESDGPFGRLRHLKPVVQLGETPPYYAKPPEPLGTSPARWI